ncbi:hypothetical protein MHK_002778 [Candidatus Magnetomorum sp. HK-1]|nr:hypothetical protein MHK_002778 [Candidatus Magnetomorum sp. HK-1]
MIVSINIDVVKAFTLYQKHIFPVCAVAKIHFGQLKKVNEKNCSTTQPFTISNFWKLEHKDSFYGKILEITPSLIDSDKCCLSLIPVKKDHSCCVQIHFQDSLKDWRELLMRKGISEGCTVEIRDTTLIGTLLTVYETIINQVALTEVSLDENDDQHKVSKIFYNPKYNELESRLNNFIENDNFSLINGDKYYNPLFIFKKFANRDTLLLENTGAAHGDLNLDNIIFHMLGNNDEDNKNLFSIEDRYELKLIDLSSFDTDYPLAFDYVKLEVEIKNHILSKDLINHLIYNEEISQDMLKLEFTNIVISFEKLLLKNTDSEIFKNNIVYNNEKFTNKMKQLFHLLLRLRISGIKKYSGRHDSHKLYMQQLFFYSLRSMMFETDENSNEIPNWRKRWAFLSALVASESLLR